jgi:small-conductance mechanosensitive channel
MNIKTFLAIEFYGNTIQNLLIALAIFLALIFTFKIIRTVIFQNLKKITNRTKTKFDDLFINLFTEIPHSFDWLIAGFIALQFINFTNDTIAKIVNAFFLIILIYRSIILLNTLLDFSLENFWAKAKKQTEESRTVILGLKIIIKAILWSAGILLILSNLGLKIGPLIASLGIGGVAIAFALQKILADLFSSFAIYFDRPFEIGDFIKVGLDSGTVKKIGLKTTRIQALSGEELVISNAELINARIQNFKKLQKRRVVFEFGVEYSTSSLSLKKIPQMIEKIITKIKDAEFSRCHFKNFGDFSLNFEVVYFVKSRDFEVYRNIQQIINFAIKDSFEKEKIEMAFPTQTINLKRRA